MFTSKGDLEGHALQFNKETYVGPFLFSGERVKLSIKGIKGGIEGTFEFVNSSSIIVQNSVKSLIPRKLQCLGRNIGFVAFMATKEGTDKQILSVERLIIENIFTTEKLNSVERDLRD